MNSAEPEFLIVGQIIRPHGVRGDVAMKIVTSYPERLFEHEQLYIGEDHTAYQIKQIRHNPKGLIIRFENISDRDMAEVLRNELVYIHIDDAVPLEDGECYVYQLIGMQVLTDDNQTLGKITDIIETGANDVYVITSETGAEILIPAIPQVVVKIDAENNNMIVQLIDGLIE